MLKTLLLAILFATCRAPAFVQTDEPWRMPGTQKANPEKRVGPLPETPSRAETKNAVQWTFPQASQNFIEYKGERLYEIASEVYAKRTAIGDNKEIEAAAVYLSPRMILSISAGLKTPLGDPALDRFLIWTAVHLSVKDSGNSGFHRYIGESVMYGLLFRLFQLTNGQFIGAFIADDKSYIIILPGPKV